MKLSIIIPTFNRFDQLKHCIKSLRVFEPSVSHEIIVIDGGSKDGTREWLFFQKDLKVIFGSYQGCVRAFNDGFRVAQGDYCAQLSDDVRVIDNCLDIACKRLDKNRNVGQIVISHLQGGKMQGPMFSTSCGRWLFAAFGITRRDLGDRVGWWGDYIHQQGDVELSVKIYTLGYDIRLLPARWHILHEPGHSEMRSFSADRKKFNARWGNWEKPSDSRNGNLQRGSVNWKVVGKYYTSGLDYRRLIDRQYG